MIQTIYTAAMLAVAAIHLLPLAGVLGAERLAALYGLKLDDPNLVVLLRHRAVLFGLLGAGLAIAAFKPAYAPAAIIAGFVSVASFLWLASPSAGLNAALQRVVSADWIALAALAVAAAAHALRG